VVKKSQLRSNRRLTPLGNQEDTVISRARIDAAKQSGPTIPQLYRGLKGRDKPQCLCRSPFREDKHPSFSIYDGGRKAKDHATGEVYDAPAFLAKAHGLPIGVALRRYVAMAEGDDPGIERAPRQMDEAPRRGAIQNKPDLARLRLPSPAEIQAIAADRGGLDPAGLEMPKRLGCLRRGLICGFASWVVTDSAGWNAEARRFGRLSYPACGQLSERKAHTIRHSTKSWPVGLGVDRYLVEKAALIAVVEGGPDLLAAWHFVYRTKRWDVLPIAILGRAIHGLHPDALALLKGKRVKFFPHVDPDDGALKQIEPIAEQLRRVGCRPTYFDLNGLRTSSGRPVKDLNHLAQLDSNQLSELHDLFL
jgi:hypothetical protein